MRMGTEVQYIYCSCCRLFSIVNWMDGQWFMSVCVIRPKVNWPLKRSVRNFSKSARSLWKNSRKEQVFTTARVNKLLQSVYTMMDWPLNFRGCATVPTSRMIYRGYLNDPSGHRVSRRRLGVGKRRKYRSGKRIRQGTQLSLRYLNSKALWIPLVRYRTTMGASSYFNKRKLS